MGFGLKMSGVPKAEVDAAVRRAAEIFRITELLDRRPKELSGGQKQRVAIGRAITRAPEVFLFDEPLSNLDAALRSQMRVELSRLHAELKATMVYVTHDQTEAMTMADRIVVINGGAIEQIGSPLDLYNRPGNLFVAGFLGSPRMNFFPAKVEACSGRTVEVAPRGAPARISVADLRRRDDSRGRRYGDARRPAGKLSRDTDLGRPRPQRHREGRREPRTRDASLCRCRAFSDYRFRVAGRLHRRPPRAAGACGLRIAGAAQRRSARRIPLRQRRARRSPSPERGP